MSWVNTKAPKLANMSAICVPVSSAKTPKRAKHTACSVQVSLITTRSEERRVGKERGCRWSRNHERKQRVKKQRKRWWREEESGTVRMLQCRRGTRHLGCQ